MLDKLARAAREAQEQRGAGYCASAEIHWPLSVRAALEAMREPTPRMIEAGVQSIERMLCERQWSAMIDAALNGERDGG